MIINKDKKETIEINSGWSLKRSGDFQLASESWIHKLIELFGRVRKAPTL